VQTKCTNSKWKKSSFSHCRSSIFMNNIFYKPIIIVNVDKGSWLHWKLNEGNVTTSECGNEWNKASVDEEIEGGMWRAPPTFNSRGLLRSGVGAFVTHYIHIHWCLQQQHLQKPPGRKKNEDKGCKLIKNADNDGTRYTTQNQVKACVDNHKDLSWWHYRKKISKFWKKIIS